MSGGPVRAPLPDGRRVHFQHGPIDLIIEAFGPAAERRRAYAQAWEVFADILPGLVAELGELRRPVGVARRQFVGPVARRMEAACQPHREVFVTPMAAVAGAVADHVLDAMVAGRSLSRAYVNNGGDIALHLAPGQRISAGVVGRPDRPAIDGVAEIAADQPVRGVATSGRAGRSLSLGIADAVTVLADSAAAADAAATLIGNEVTCAHPGIERVPARDLDPDSDLGDRPVTVAVRGLDSGSVEAALEAGAGAARRMLSERLIHGAYIQLEGRHRMMDKIPRGPKVLPRDRERKFEGTALPS